MPSAADVVSRRERSREVIEAVLSLPEPYLTTVLMRFYEGLPPREIAERTKTRVGTVHRRLQRALAVLRELGE